MAHYGEVFSNGVEGSTKRLYSAVHLYKNKECSEDTDDSWEFFRLLTKEILNNKDILMPSRDSKVIDFLHPDQLTEVLDLEIRSQPTPCDRLLEACRIIIKHSLKSNHPMFLSRLYKGVDGYGLGGAWLTEALNTTQTTYEVGPAFTLIEKSVIRQVREQILGWSPGGEGLFCPGGSLANMFAMSLARFRACPGVKAAGLRAFPPLVCYVSDQGHYSTKKGASFMGLGSDSVHVIPTDEQGRMIPEALGKAIEEDLYQEKLPFFVCSTSGTTVLGAFDPLKPIGDICKSYGLWHHVDAAWGGTALLSPNYRYLLCGIEENVDSVTWNFHKMAGAPLQCSLLVCKHEGMLYKCNSNYAEYLFQEDKYYDTRYDTGDESIQCGRKVDALKLWTLLKGHGFAGMAHLVDEAFDTARYLTDKLRRTEGFRLVLPEFEFTNVCFWFIPPSLRKVEENDLFWKKIAKVAIEIKKQLVMEGKILIDYHPVTSKSFVNFFRVPIHCVPVPSREDMDFLVREICRIGNSL